VREVLRLADLEQLDRAAQAFEKLVRDRLVHEHAARPSTSGRRRRTPTRRARARLVQVGVRVHDHAVLAAHLGHDTLHVALARSGARACSTISSPTGLDR
jgi:hypothetical protein